VEHFFLRGSARGASSICAALSLTLQTLSFASVKTAADYTQKRDPLQDNCPVRAALDVIRGRWKPSILLRLKPGPARFSEIHTALKGSTAQAITVQLRQLEADGVVSRTAFPEIPPRVEYALSPFGRTLSDLMDQLELWGTEYLRRRSAPKKSRK
jgi:DNA-binding HxlR family transcriptional regulator